MPLMNASPWNNLPFERLAIHSGPMHRPALDTVFPGSSAVEHPTVNRTADGSNPSRGATFFADNILVSNIKVVGLARRDVASCKQ